MDQRTHSWIAIRAIALLEDNDDIPELVSLLKPRACKATIGAWLPDQTDAKRGDSGSKTDNHVFKMEVAENDPAGRFVMSKAELLEHIGLHRQTAQFLQQDQSLDMSWWKTSYRGDVPKPGQHLPNRIMALSTHLKDLLIIGNKDIRDRLPYDGSFLQAMDPRALTRAEAAVVYFFMLSHFVADISMPCHCDARKLAAYKAGLHKQWECYWSKLVTTSFDKAKILQPDAKSDQILQKAREVDAVFSLHFESAPIPDFCPKQDPWLEAIHLCRASFAVASIVTPCHSYPYGETDTVVPFKTVFGNGKEQLLADVNRVALHDAVLNTAIFWKHIWRDVSGK